MEAVAVRRLTLLRRQRGWSQRQLGILLREFGNSRALSQREVSDLERGWLNPRPEVLSALGRLFGVDTPSRLLEPIHPEVLQ